MEQETALQLYPTADQYLSLSQEKIDTIFRLIEQTRPEEITSPSHLICIGTYHFAQVRVAIASAAILHAQRDPHFVSIRHTKKTTTDGLEARIMLFYPENQPGLLPKRVKLEISTATAYVLEYEFPILEPQSGWDTVSIRYSDFRPPKRITSLYRLQQEGAKLEDIHHLWQGLRFLCRNLREWEQEGITWPEELS